MKEPYGGAHKNPSKVAKMIKSVLLSEVKEINEIDRESLVEIRYNKFRRMGEYI